MPEFRDLLSLIIIVSYLKFTDCQIKWSVNFEGPTVTDPNYINTSCSFHGLPTCCSILSQEIAYYKSSKFSSNVNDCRINRVYFPSPYESHSRRIILELQAIADDNERGNRMLELLSSEIEAVHSKKWLKLVQQRMSNVELPPTSDDKYYLSVFEVTRTCGNDVKSWTEWIEPLTIHFRHPFAFSDCHFVKVDENIIPKTGIQATDHILVKNGNNPDVDRQSHSRKILIDAGTSRFDSSLWWFLCAYDTVSIDIDEIFGFEYSLLEPGPFWDMVPDKYFPRYHFYNIPIAFGKTKQNPLQLIRRIAKPEDFVSFKLDVDTADVEIPIALKLLNSPSLLELVDEFFFELHFRCDYMNRCGWDYRGKPPEKLAGLVLDRPHAFDFFQSLRKRGVRAHVWP